MPIQFDPELNNEYEFPEGTPPEEAQRAMNQVRQVAQAQAVLGPLGQAANQMMGGGNQHPMGAPPSPETAFAMGPEWYQQEMAQREGARQHQVESQQQQQYMQQQQQQHQAQMGMEQRRLTQAERQMIEDRQQAAKDRQLQIKAMREEQKAEEAQREFEREQAERQREWNAAQPVRLSQGAQMVDPQTGEVIHQAPYRPLRSAGGAGGTTQQFDAPMLYDMSVEELAMLPHNASMLERMLNYSYPRMNTAAREQFMGKLKEHATQYPNTSLAYRVRQTGLVGPSEGAEAFQRAENLDVTQRQQGQGEGRETQTPDRQQQQAEPQQTTYNDRIQQMRSELQGLRARLRGRNPYGQELTEEDLARIQELERNLEGTPTPWQELTDTVAGWFRPSFSDPQKQSRFRELRVKRGDSRTPSLTPEEETELEQLEREAEYARRVGEPQPRVTGGLPR